MQMSLLLRVWSFYLLNKQEKNSHKDCLERWDRSFTNEPKASDLQAFRVFSQHPAWVITPLNP